MKQKLYDNISENPTPFRRGSMSRLCGKRVEQVLQRVHAWARLVTIQ